MLFISSTPVLIRHLWQLKTFVFLHWCLIHAVQLVLNTNAKSYSLCCLNFMMSVSIKSSMASVIVMSAIMLNTVAPNEGEMSFSTIQLERSHRQTTFTLLYRF